MRVHLGFAISGFLFAALCVVPAPAQNCSIQADFYRVEAKEGLNLRSGPGLKFPVRKTLKPNGRITHYQFDILESRGEWLRFGRVSNAGGGIAYNRGGWVYGPLLSFNVPDEAISARSRPNEEAPVVHTLPANTEYPLTGCSGSWARVSYADRNDRIRPGWVKVVGKMPNETRCEAAAFASNPRRGVNIRSGPGTSHRIVESIKSDPNNSLFMIDGASGDWLKVSDVIAQGGKNKFRGNGWVLARLLSVKLDGSDVASGGLRVFAHPGGRRISYSGFGVNVPLVSCTGNWLKVRLPVTGTGVGNTSATGWVTSGSFCGTPWGDCR